MKRSSTCRIQIMRRLPLKIGSIIALVAASLFPLRLAAATIKYVGSVEGSEVNNWRDPAVAKTLDLDGDGIYGSTLGAVNWLHGSVGEVSAGSGNYGWSYKGGNTFGQFSNDGYPMVNTIPDTNPLSTQPAGIMAVQWGGTFIFGLEGGSATYSGKVVRLGIMADCLSPGEGAADHDKTFRVTGPGGGDSGVISLRGGAAGNNTPELYFFDITDVNAGDTFTILTDGPAVQPGYIGPVSWDIGDLGGPPTITEQPLGATCLLGVPFQFSVVAGGSKPLSYQWYKGTDLLIGAEASVLDFPSLDLGNAGTYTVVVSNAQGSVTSAPVILAVETAIPDKLMTYQTAVRDELFLISSYPFDYRNASDALGLNNGTLVGTARFGAGVAGGADQALLLSGGGHVNLGTIADFTFPSGKGAIEAWVRADWSSSPGYSPCLFANRDGGSTRYSLHMSVGKDQLLFWNGATAPSISIPPAGNAWHLLTVSFDSGNWTVYWDGQNMATVAQAFGTATGLPTQIGSASPASTAEGWVGALDEVSFFSDTLSAEQVQSHYLAFAVGDPPSIQTQPRGGQFLIGAPFTLSAYASGAELGYQWFKNKEPVSGATANTLDFPSLSSGDSGDYQLVVTNPVGSATSLVATLDVRVPDSQHYQSVVRAEPSLLSFYPFDDGTANDALANHHGTSVGTSAFGPGLGGTGDQALLFSGGGLVALGAVPDFEFADGTGTVEAWVRADWDVAAPPPYNPCIFANREEPKTRWSLHMLQNKSQLAFWNGTAASFASIPPVGNAWHLFTCVFDAGSWRVFWDGQPVATAPSTIGFGDNSGLPTQLGSSMSVTANESWIGALDGVAFYRDALSASQAASHYSAMIDPALHYTFSGASLTISWPAALQGFSLECAEALAGATWELVPGVVDNSVTVDVSNGTKFYRLRR